MWVDVDICGKNTKVVVKGIGTWKLVLHGEQDLIQHDVLFAPEIRQNIITVLVLLRLGFDWHFHDTEARLFWETTYLSSDFVRDGLILMDLDVGSFNSNASFFLFASSRNYENDVNIWHARLGHIAKIVCKGLQKKVC